MTNKQRLIRKLYEEFGYSEFCTGRSFYQELGEALDIKPDTVRAMMHKLRRAGVLIPGETGRSSRLNPAHSMPQEKVVRVEVKTTGAGGLGRMMKYPAFLDPFSWRDLVSRYEAGTVLTCHITVSKEGSR